MATIFYFPSNYVAPSISPGIHSDWTRSVSLIRGVPIRNTPSASANADQFVTDAGTNPSHECRQQWIYGPLAAQTIGAQNIGIGIMGHHGSTWGFHWLKATAYILKGDLTGRRGTMATIVQLADLSSSFPANTPYSTRYAETGAGSSTSVTTVAGDWLVIEIGYENQSGTNMTTYFQLGDNNGADIVAANEGSTTNRNAMLKFGTTSLLLQAPSALVYSNNNQTVSTGSGAADMNPSNSGGGISSYAVQTGALPAGVNLSATTGIISGVPTLAGVYAWTIRGTGDGGATTDSGALGMTVADPSLPFTTGWTFDLEL